MTGPKRRLAAILAADVVGYSRLMAADDQGTVAALDAARAVFRRAVGAEDGRVVDTAGDSVLAVFETATGAVRAAIASQDEINRTAEAAPNDRRMRFRIGITLGEVIEKPDGTVYGDGVNIAARLEAASDPGGITISGTAHDHVQNRVDAGWRDLGMLEVKNIPQPVRAYGLTTDIAEPDRETSPSRILPDRPSIAVLPFDNLSGDPAQEHFADGISEDLITGLSRMRWLFVTARNSCFAYKGQSPDVREVGRGLGVRYVLEGSVRKGGNRVRVTAQLIDATTGTHVWAERYDRELVDLFDLQDEITDAIVAAVGPELDATERERARRKPPENLNAWECYQKGLWHLYRITQQDNGHARDLFRQAHDLDPGFAPAAAAMALSLSIEVATGWAEARADTIEEGLSWARLAVQLDDRDTMSRFALGRVYFVAGDTAASVAEFRKAIEANPNHPQIRYSLGMALLAQAEPPETAISEFDMANRLSPHDPIGWAPIYGKALALMTLGRHDEALVSAREAVRHPNAGWMTYVGMIAILGHLGRTAEIDQPLARLLELQPDFTPSRVDIMPGPDSPTAERLREGLRKAGLTDPG